MKIDLIVYDERTEDALANAILEYLSDYQKEVWLEEEEKRHRWYTIRPPFQWLLGVLIGLIIASVWIYTQGV